MFLIFIVYGVLGQAWYLYQFLIFAFSLSYFYAFLLFFNVFINIYEYAYYANKIICIFYHKLKALCPSVNYVRIIVVYGK